MLNVSSQHKAEQIYTSYKNFVLRLGSNTASSGHASSRLWVACVDSYEMWDKYEQEWTKTSCPMGEGLTPSKAIESLWKLLIFTPIHRTVEEGHVWMFKTQMARFYDIGSDDPDYPVVKDTAFLDTMEWPPTEWHLPEPQSEDGNWAVSHDNYVKVDGKKIKVKHLKVLIHELSLYYENDIEPTGEAKNQAEQLKNYGFWYLTEAEKEKEAAKAAYTAKKKVMNQGLITHHYKIGDIDHLIADQMTTWAKVDLL